MTPDWSGQSVLIVACGPSAAWVDLELFRGWKVIAVNEAWRLCPRADVLYGADEAFWAAGRGDGFGGLKVRGADLNIEGDAIRFEREPGAAIGSGGTGAFQALNLAVQWGATRVGLVGVDARTDLGEHWHAPTAAHRSALDPVAVARWIKAFDDAAPVLAAAGIEVVNHSGVSALTGFRKEPLPEIMAMHVRFTQDHDYTPVRAPRATTAYKAGWSGPVPTPCGLRAIELGRAVKVAPPPRSEAVHIGPTPARRTRKKA